MRSRPRYALARGMGCLETLWYPHDVRVLRSTRVIVPVDSGSPGSARVAAADILIENGRIHAVRDHASSGVRGRDEIIDVGDRVVMPGVVETHAHINEPGRADWEGFETGTRAAARGGVTTLVDMPLNSIPPTTTRRNFEVKIREARDRVAIDCGFWGGVVPDHVNELRELAGVGVMGFKAFLVPSGVEEFPHVRERDLLAAMPILADAKLPLLVHAELELGPPSPTASLPTSEGAGEEVGPRRYGTYLASRPRVWENEAVRLVIRLARQTGCAVHIVHLSSADAIPDLIEARREGLPITVETCPHYLTFASEEIPDGATHFKCAPPIRERENRERLWSALVQGHIDLVVSDHSPCTPELKRLESGDFSLAWGGISSLQLGLSVIWTEARARGLDLTDVVRWMCHSPPRIAGLERKKGAIRAGLDADLVVFDPDRTFLLEPSMIHHRHPVTPYMGRTLQGIVEATYLRGEAVYERARGVLARRGELLLHDRA